MGKILVFGGSGFIGSHLIDRLVNEGEKVVVFDINKPRQDVEFKKISILDKSLEKNVIEEDFGRIVNLVAIRKVFPENYHDALKTNVIGCARIFEIAKNLQIPIIHFSSTALYGEFLKVPADETHPLNPISLYGFSKLLGEEVGRKIMENSNSSCVIFRPTIVYGPGGDDVITSFIKNALNNKPLTIFDGGIYRRDFLFVKDLVDAITMAIKRNISGIFNVGSGSEVTILEIAKMIQKFIPSAEIIDAKSNKKEINQGALDISKIKRELNFQPRYSLEMGIKETIDYYSGSSQQLSRSS